MILLKDYFQKKSLLNLKEKLKRNPGNTGSLAIHFLLVIFIIGGLPSFFEDNKSPIEVITIDVVPVIKKKEPEKSKPQIVKKKVIPKYPIAKITSKPKPPKVNKPVAKPIAKPEIVKKKPIKKPIKPKPEIKKPKPEKIIKKSEGDEFDKMLKNMLDDKSSKKPTKPATKPVNKTLSSSEKMAIVKTIITQIERQWNLPAGIRNTENIKVTLRISLSIDGAVKKVRIVNKSRYNSGDAVFIAVVDSAVRAAYKASPIKNLPPKQYSIWREVEPTFDPKYMDSN